VATQLSCDFENLTIEQNTKNLRVGRSTSTGIRPSLIFPNNQKKSGTRILLVLGTRDTANSWAAGIVNPGKLSSASIGLERLVVPRNRTGSDAASRSTATRFRLGTRLLRGWRPTLSVTARRADTLLNIALLTSSVMTWALSRSAGNTATGVSDNGGLFADRF